MNNLNVECACIMGDYPGQVVGDQWLYRKLQTHDQVYGQFTISCEKHGVDFSSDMFDNDTGETRFRAHLIGKPSQIFDTAIEALICCIEQYDEYIKINMKWIPPMTFSRTAQITYGYLFPYRGGIIAVSTWYGLYELNGTRIQGVEKLEQDINRYFMCDRSRSKIIELYMVGRSEKYVRNIIEKGSYEEKSSMDFVEIDEINLKRQYAERNDCLREPIPIDLAVIKEYLNRDRKEFAGVFIFEANRRYEPGYKGHMSNAVRIYRRGDVW